MGNLCRNQTFDKEEAIFDEKNRIQSEQNLVSSIPLQEETNIFKFTPEKIKLEGNNRYSNEQNEISLRPTVDFKSDNFSQINEGEKINNSNSEFPKLKGGNNKIKSFDYINEQKILLNNKPYFTKTVFDLINLIRENPPFYADKIEEAIKYIKEEKKIITDPVSGKQTEQLRIVFKNKVKVLLAKGEIAFREAANILRNTKPIYPYEFNDNIVIPLPKNEKELKDPNYLKNKAKEKRKKTNIEVYYKDCIKDPFISILLMIVDDNYINEGKKRETLLSSKYKYIGITSKFINQNFVAFFSFAE